MQNDRSLKVGRLYFISSEAQRAVKVGFADDLGLRLANLQTGNPSPLKINFSHSATLGAERLLHSYLKPYRIKREWYPDIWLLDDLYDELGYLLVDRAMEEAAEDDRDYLECFDEQHLTEADIREVVPGSIAAYQAWLDAGAQPDPDEICYMHREAEAVDLLARMHGALLH